MLSVLIPVQNWKLTGLVASLLGQLNRSGVPYEILIGEDGSEPECAFENQKLTGILNVSYFLHRKALGRSRNRNFLAGRSKYDYLLFIDGDAGVTHADFIQKYIDLARPDRVVCGGTLYSEEPPADPGVVLRWKYGRKREQRTSRIRNRHPWNSFSTFNFLIPRTLFNQIRFDEGIRKYGHEDTLFGYHLKLLGFNVLHVDNELIHLGIEPSVQFLAKTRDSVENLAELYLRGKLPPERIKRNSLLRTWIVLKKLGLSSLVKTCFNRNRKRLEMKLSGPDPSIFLFDLYKLGLISQIG